MDFFFKLLFVWVLSALLTLVAWAGFFFFGWWGLLFVAIATYWTAAVIAME